MGEAGEVEAPGSPFSFFFILRISKQINMEAPRSKSTIRFVLYVLSFMQMGASKFVVVA